MPKLDTTTCIKGTFYDFCKLHANYKIEEGFSFGSK